MKNCPCHSGQSYSLCCQPFHLGKPATTPVTLMRSRYSAYALNIVNYIIQTTHPDNPICKKNFSKWSKELETFCILTEFTGLNILNFKENEKKAFVTFRAELSQHGNDISFTEKSTFIKELDHWYYLDGFVEKTL